MTIEILLLLIIIGVSLVLFSIERLPADVIALGILLTLVLTGLLPADQAFAGFGSDAVILILGLLILTASLVRTGVVDLAGREIMRRTGTNLNRMLALVMVVPAVLSAFISNTASTAFFLPIVIGMARRARISYSYLLMPLAFATILASSVTLVATSTNILVSGLMVQAHLPPLGVFELAPIGVPILAVGILYMLTVGWRMIPNRYREQQDLSNIGTYPYLTEAVVLPGSSLDGKTLDESGLGRDLDLTVLRLVRGNKKLLAPRADVQLQEGDELLLEGARDEVLKIRNKTGIDFRESVSFSDAALQSEDVTLAEVILLPRSPLIGRRLTGLRLRERFGLQVLAINRHGETIHRRISNTSLMMGDVLLVQGAPENIAALEQDMTFRVLGALEDTLPNVRRAPIAIAAFVFAIILGASGLVTLPVAMIAGVVIVFITRCITPEEAYREVEWKALILIGSMLGLGQALEFTGAAEYLAVQIVESTRNLNPAWLLGGFFLLTMLLTQPMSNQAAAVVVVPIALQTAFQLELNPRTFAAMIAVAASCSFMTPLEPACLIIYGAGHYKFIDFIKVGTPLTLLIFILAIILVPQIWPL